MHIERIDGQQGLLLRESVEINIGNNETRWTTIGILEDPLKVALDRDGRPCEAMEHWNSLRTQSGSGVIRLGDAVEETGEEVYDLGHHLRALKLSHCCTCRELLFVFCIVCGWLVFVLVFLLGAFFFFACLWDANTTCLLPFCIAFTWVKGLLIYSLEIEPGVFALSLSQFCRIFTSNLVNNKIVSLVYTVCFNIF